MGSKAYKECNKIGCYILTKEKYCEAHQQEKTDYEQHRPNAQQRGYDYRWQQYSKRFLRANPLCAYCLKENKSTPSEVTDHIKDHKGNQQLFWDAGNHQPLCKKCHDKKTFKDNRRYKAYRIL